MRFTLSKLFLAVTMVALACAGITFCTRWWASGIVILSVLLYVFVTIRAIVSQGQIRATSIAFSLVGGGYLLLTLCSAFSPMRDLLLTNQVLIAVGKLRHFPPMVNATWTGPDGKQYHFNGFADQLAEITTKATNLKVTPVPSQDRELEHLEFGNAETFDPVTSQRIFLVIGHCVWSWLFAVLAAWLAAMMYVKRTQTREA